MTDDLRATREGPEQGETGSVTPWVVLAVLLSGCVPPLQTEKAPEQGTEGTLPDFVDRRNGVACYVYRGYGLSCVYVPNLRDAAAENPTISGVTR